MRPRVQVATPLEINHRKALLSSFHLNGHTLLKRLEHLQCVAEYAALQEVLLTSFYVNITVYDFIQSEPRFVTQKLDHITCKRLTVQGCGSAMR